MTHLTKLKRVRRVRFVFVHLIYLEGAVIMFLRDKMVIKLALTRSLIVVQRD